MWRIYMGIILLVSVRVTVSSTDFTMLRGSSVNSRHQIHPANKAILHIFHHNVISVMAYLHPNFPPYSTDPIVPLITKAGRQIIIRYQLAFV